MIQKTRKTTKTYSLYKSKESSKDKCILNSVLYCSGCSYRSFSAQSRSNRKLFAPSKSFKRCISSILQVNLFCSVNNYTAHSNKTLFTDIFAISTALQDALLANQWSNCENNC